ncbi:P-loop NTPase family protein [Sphingobium agri]|uniref:Adenylate kinase n=1 Tax=Sphingobium agri TaxID=2933566 RepID=A0ABT0DX03_9SPHN|nr:hypothetical protein [Sphingobium agri]MCK0531584.1 hypothetical protein [Sphingobium agri]
MSKIYITGASCSGVTTLGSNVARRLDLLHLDVDDFYWEPTNPPFTTKREPEERVRLILEALGDDDWILTGSFDGWGDALIRDVNLIVFVVTPTAIRMQRLSSREEARFGDRVLAGGDMHKSHTAFRKWAEQYDDANFPGRNRARHEAWLLDQSAPVLRLDGTLSPEILTAKVIEAVALKPQR